MKEPDELKSAAVRSFAVAILHGDNEHRAWLTDAAEAFIAGTPLPPPNGKGRAEAAEAFLALIRDQIDAALASLRR